MRLHPRLRSVAIAALLVVATFVADPAEAQEPTPPAPAHIGDDLANVRVEGPAAAAAQAVYDEVASRLAAAVTARTTAEAELASLAAREVELTALLAAETANRKAAGLQVAAARQAVEEAAVGSRQHQGVRGRQGPGRDRSARAPEPTGPDIGVGHPYL
jgi:hypothetical protein